ncbi:MAG: histidine kinase [Cyclobacteriaceae bacterium]
MSRTRWYWTLQISGWTLYGVIGTVIANYFYAINIQSIAFQIFGATMMLLVTHFLRFQLKRRGWIKLKIKRMLVRLIPLLVLLAFLANGLTTGFGLKVTDMIPIDQFSFGIFLLYTLQTFVYLSLWTGIYLIIYFFRNYKREEIEKWKFQSAVKDAELIALKAQINPHFLFNSLNNIRALILEDHMKARDMVSHLSELLRYSIQFNSNEKVSIWEELDIVEKYLELESIHYENRLKFEIETDKKLGKYKIPPMIIQLMTENAVKHGISQLKDGGNINVSVSSEKEELILQVSNTGRLKERSKTGGIGLRNATERIRILFEKEPDLDLFQDGEMVRSVLKLPLEQ